VLMRGWLSTMFSRHGPCVLGSLRLLSAGWVLPVRSASVAPPLVSRFALFSPTFRRFSAFAREGPGLFAGPVLVPVRMSWLATPRPVNACFARRLPAIFADERFSFRRGVGRRC